MDIKKALDWLDDIESTAHYANKFTKITLKTDIVKNIEEIKECLKHMGGMI